MSRIDAILNEIFSLSSIEESMLLNILEERKILLIHAHTSLTRFRNKDFVLRQIGF